MRGELVPVQYPRVPIGRRAAALGIDFVAVGLISAAVGTQAIAQAIVFLLLWFGLRVVTVSRNKGQSLGRWALDMRVIDPYHNNTPGLMELSKREGVLGIAALLALWGILNLSPAKPWSLLLFLPLAADCGLALFDPRNRQAFHDQLSGTLMVQTRRGYSLDIKIKAQ